DAVEIGDVPDLLGLLGDRRDEVGMRVAERVHRHPRGEIEVALAVGRSEPSALAALEREIDARIGRQQMRCLNATHHKPGGGQKRNVPPLRAARYGILLRYHPLSTRSEACSKRPRRPPQVLTRRTEAQIDVDACCKRDQNMWKQPERTLAPDSRHIVAFRSESTTFRAADWF